MFYTSISIINLVGCGEEETEVIQKRRNQLWIGIYLSKNLVLNLVQSRAQSPVPNLLQKIQEIHKRDSAVVCKCLWRMGR